MTTKAKHEVAFSVMFLDYENHWSQSNKHNYREGTVELL